jgi:exportin-5
MATNGLSAGSRADIIKALELIYDSSSTNDLRLQALQYLEKQKQGDSAAPNGYLLASHLDNLPMVRYFGLSVLENVVRHTAFDASDERLLDLRNMVMRLAESISPQDPIYYRNKVAQLWADLAKRSWGLDWLNMDETMVQFWSADLVHKEVILTVLETLSEDVFYREDVISSLRGSDLNRALVEIFTPMSVFEDALPERGHHTELRSGTEGWLARTCSFLDNCVEAGPSSPEARAVILKALAVLRSSLAWAMPTAIISCQCIASVCRTLTLQDDKILLVRSPIPYLPRMPIFL